MKSVFFTRAAAAAAALVAAAGVMAYPAFAADGEGKRSTREQDAQTMNSVYFLPDSDTYYISEDDISWMDDEELMLARNEFYARKGRRFVTKSIRDYFNSQSWYDGRIDPDDFSNDVFNRYEKANIDFILAYEKERSKGRKKKEDKEDKEGTATSSGLSGMTTEYEKVRDLYGDAFRHSWTKEECRAHGLTMLVPEMDSLKELGYTCKDLDDDGIEEFLVGPTDTREYGEGAVFGIYTMKDGKAFETVSADEDTSLFICKDGTIRKEKEYENGSWEIDYYDLKDGELFLKSVLVMDEEEGGEEPWFAASDVQALSKDEDILQDLAAMDHRADAAGIESNIKKEADKSSEGIEELSPISYKEASEIRTSYSADTLNLTSFK